MNMLDDVDFQIARLSLAPGEILAVRVNRPITSIVAAELTAKLQRKIGVEYKVLVIDSSTELTVVGKREAKRLANVAA